MRFSAGFGLLAVCVLAFSVATTKTINSEKVEGIEKVGKLEEVVVIGSSIRRDPYNEPTAVTAFVKDDVVNTGI